MAASLAMSVYYFSMAYIYAKTWSWTIMNAYLRSTNEGNASWPLMGLKDRGKVQNRRVAKSWIFLIIINAGR